MPIFEITQDRLILLQPTTFSDHGLQERGDLQRLLRDKVEIIAPDVMVISEEFGGWEDSKRRIDLLSIGVEWKKHFQLREAKTFKGVFSNPNIVCKLSDPATVTFVR